MIKLVFAKLADLVEASRKLKRKALTASEQVYYTAQRDSLREIFEDF